MIEKEPEPAPGCAVCRDGQDVPIQFAMAFQPIVDLRTRTSYAYEALVRGPTGEGALHVLSQVTDANRYPFDQACRVKAIETTMAASLLATGARLSINFMPNAIYSPLACIQLTLRNAHAAGLPHKRLIFEFTENEEMVAPDHVDTIIETYRRMGFGVAIDDFGTGHAGLACFRPDIVKLDMALVRGVERDVRRRAIVRAMVGLCYGLETLLVAEGWRRSTMRRRCAISASVISRVTFMRVLPSRRCRRSISSEARQQGADGSACRHDRSLRL